MAMDDLYTALKMFSSGVKELGLARAINGANEQVQQIKASEANEAEKRAQLTAISQQLVAHMGAFGAPVEQIQAQAANVAPKQFANANQMNIEAMLTGNGTLAKQADQQQTFEMAPKKTLAMIKAQHAADPLRQAQFQALQDERFIKHTEALDKRVDTQTARFGNIARLQGTINQIDDVTPMLTHGQLTPQTIREAATKLDNILSGGAATLAGTEHLTPHTFEQWKAKAKEFITSDPQTVNLQEFRDFYLKSLGRIREVNNKIIRGAQKQVLESSTGLAKSNPDAFATYAESRGFKVDVDRKSGRVKATDIAESQAQKPQLVPVMVKDKSGNLVKALKDPATGQLFAAPTTP